MVVKSTQGESQAGDSRARRIGLTGGIATGKSTVAKMLVDLGAAMIDADRIAREVVRPGEKTLNDVVQAFGPEILTEEGTLNRGRLGEIIFSDPYERQRLNKIMHPVIVDRIIQEANEMEKKVCGPIVFDIPLLFETEAHRRYGFDEIVLVYVDRATQILRLKARDHVDESTAESRLQAQLPIEEKRRMSDKIIDNRGTRAQTLAQVESLWKEWVSGADCTHRP